MDYYEQYYKKIDEAFDLAKNGETEKIISDFSIVKMFCSISNIFSALRHFDKFNDLIVDQLKKLVEALIKGQIKYSKTTNQALRTDTTDWIIGILRTKISVYSNDKNEIHYLNFWISELFNNKSIEYNYSNDIGKHLEQKYNENELVRLKYENEKAERLAKEENEIEKRFEEKRKIYFEHLEKNQKQKEIRDIFLAEFSTYSLTKKLRIIISDTKPLYFYPTEISDVQNEILIELNVDERDRLYKMIKKQRMVEWYKTRDRIQVMDKKYHS